MCWRAMHPQWQPLQPQVDAQPPRAEIARVGARRRCGCASATRGVGGATRELAANLAIRLALVRCNEITSVREFGVRESDIDEQQQQTPARSWARATWFRLPARRKLGRARASGVVTLAAPTRVRRKVGRICRSWLMVRTPDGSGVRARPHSPTVLFETCLQRGTPCLTVTAWLPLS
eukprot:351188-Chlamydomonas_euryale.AAC.5